MNSVLKWILLLFIYCDLFGQYSHKFAPEKWSEPVLVKGIENQYAIDPYISYDGKTLFFNAYMYVEKTDTGWSEIKQLNSNIKKSLVRITRMTPDGKTLFFTFYYMDNWDLFYSEWDSLKHDWGVAKWGGYELNTEATEDGPSFPDDTTMIFLRSGLTHISHYNKASRKWSTAQEWPGKEKGFNSHLSIFVTKDIKKMYKTLLLEHPNDDIDYDMCVQYKDNLIGQFPGSRGYTYPMILNITLYSDSLKRAGKIANTYEGQPVLTPDGKTMYFTANYTAVGEYRIYESHMIIDENGEPVTSVENKNTPLLPETITVYPLYPNPFNPLSTLRYSLPAAMKIKITLYDITGRKVRDLKDAIESGGEHSVNITADNLSSGIYLIHIQSPYQSLVRKAVVLK